MTTNIVFNGSKWAGEAPDTIEELLEVLRLHPLDPSFEKYGGFVSVVPNEIAEHYKVDPVRAVCFGGNFYEVSHAFGIYTDEEETIARLTAAIRENMQTPAYAAAKVVRRDQDKQRAEREHMFAKRGR